MAIIQNIPGKYAHDPGAGPEIAGILYYGMSLKSDPGESHALDKSRSLVYLLGAYSAF